MLQRILSIIRPQPTFTDLADQWLAEKSVIYRPKWISEARRILAKDLLPTLGTRPANRITRRDITRAMQLAVERGSPGMAGQTMSMARAVFTWAIETGRFDGPNPAQGMKKPQPWRPRRRVLSDAELRAVWHIDAPPQAQAILRLQLLSACRIGEVCGAEKREIDAQSRTWTIAGERTKNHKDHTLPLSPAAWAIVEPRLSGGEPWVFPGILRSGPQDQRSGPIRYLRGLQLGIHSHDLRRTAATRMGDLGVSDDVIGLVLNHSPESVTRIHYQHSRRTGQMRAALERWAAELQRTTL